MRQHFFRHFFLAGLACLALPTPSFAMDWRMAMCQWATAMEGRAAEKRHEIAESGGQIIPVPLGMSVAQFWSLLAELQGLQLEAAVLTGSRTHFSYGYAPQKSSDLDLLLFAGETKSFPNVGKNLPFPVNAWNPLLWQTFHRDGDTLKFPRSMQEDIELHDQAQREISLTRFFPGLGIKYVWREMAFNQNPFVTPEQRQERFDAENIYWMEWDQYPLVVGKESIFILYSQPEASAIRLRELGFTHVFSL